MSDGLRRKAVIPVDEVETGDEIYYTWEGERFRVGDVSHDPESGYRYFALLNRRSREFVQLDRIKPEKDVTVYTTRDCSHPGGDDE